MLIALIFAKLPGGHFHASTLYDIECCAQFHKARSTKMYPKHMKSFLVETGYLPKFEKVNIVANGAPLKCCLAKTFAKQYVLLNSFLSPGHFEPNHGAIN